MTAAMARQEPGYLSDMGQSGSASPAWPHGLRERNRPVCVGVSFLSQLSLFPNKYSSFQRDGSLRGQPFSPRSSTVLQGASGNFWGLFDCHSLGMGALWAFIRLGEGIRDDMFSALHNKKTPCLKHPVSLLRRAGDLVFLVLGGAASTPRTRT